MVGPSDVIRRWLAPIVLLAINIFFAPTTASPQQRPFPERVEIRRTQYGVPHILADDLAAAFFGLAYCHSEDYGDRVAIGLIRARGELARFFGQDSISGDFLARQTYNHAVETYHLLGPDIRDAFEGYAAGVNYYVRLHPDEFPDWMQATFSGHDVAASWIAEPRQTSVRRFMRRLTQAQDTAQAAQPEEGSNAWAFAPTRSASGSAILVRNPHLSWDAGYYEAHIKVPGVINFYGDFRVGYPLYFNGGFNDNLGWATTNNGFDPDEIYALDVDPQRPDHYVFDTGSVPLRRELVTVEFKNGEGLARETREFWYSPLGPVFHRGGGKIYVLRFAGFEEYRAAEQFLRMMRARNLGEFKSAMRMRAQLESNFTYADREGNIYYLWNATIPSLPHKSGGDSAAVPAKRTAEVWTQIVPFGALPQVENPPGGYLHNENDPFHYANLNQVLDSTDYPSYFPRPELRLRSQHALELIHNDRVFTLEEIIELKHSMRMLLADRVKGDLVAAVRASAPTAEVAAAIDMIEAWDNTVAAQSRGGVLFETWFRRYLTGADSVREGGSARLAWDSAFARPWTPLEPMTTPRGLSDPTRAAEAFVWAVEATKEQFGSWDVAWGDVHRLRIGDVDVPVGGCTGQLGCFRVLWFRDADNGKRVATGGDGWVLAVEFGDQPRAYSVLAYGQSSKEDSPHFNDQAEIFANNRMKPVAFTEDEIRAQLIRRYRPGKE